MKNNIEELIQDAELGNVDSQFQLGKMYFTGQGIKQDLCKAFNWWKTAAEHNEPKSQLCLSCMYRYGDIVEINKEYADELYDKSTYYLEYSIENNIIDMYNEFRNIEKDTDVVELYWTASFFDRDGNYKQAKRYYERAMSLGDISAKVGLGILYLYGNGVKKNYKKAYELFYEAAQQNSDFAQWLIGTMYEEGVSQDYKLAKEWYEKASSNGSSSALVSLGELYEKGLGVAKDYDKAIYWYTKAADKGDAEAQVQLGWIYDVIFHNYGKAREYYEKSAEQGNAWGQFRLGFLYNYNGSVLSKPDYNFQKAHEIAFQLFEKAAHQGLAIAQFWLGQCYEKGEGIEQNIEKAIECYEKAAELGNIPSLTNLGDLYYEGRDVKQDYLKAFDLYIKAAKQGEQTAMINLAKMFYEGKGVEQDFRLALKLFETERVLYYDGKGAIHFILGQMYEKGEGTEKNLLKAQKYYEYAAKAHYEDAVFALEKLRESRRKNLLTESSCTKQNWHSSSKYEKIVKDIIKCSNESKYIKFCISFQPSINMNNTDCD